MGEIGWYLPSTAGASQCTDPSIFTITCHFYHRLWYYIEMFSRKYFSPDEFSNMTQVRNQP